MKKDFLKIGNRPELMLDTFLLEVMSRVSLQMNPPVRREVVLKMDQPWEGRGSGIYSVVLKDSDLYRMYYRATFPDRDPSLGQEGCAYAESTDGISWERKNLGIYSYKGQDTNIMITGDHGHNFSPFIDRNPNCPPEERYKAVAGHRPPALFGYKSADGIHWEQVQADPLFSQGAFDSHNLAFFDTNLGSYVCYSRYFATRESAEKLSTGIRAIQRNLSADFLGWTAPEPLTYDPGVPFEHFYTNAVTPCPGAEHFYLAFPMRFLHERYKNPECSAVGVSDNVIMSSRDGLHWSRPHLESWVRPGLDPQNWTHRNLITAQGILETGDEFSLFINENYAWDSSYIRRVTVPRHRFSSVHADRGGGVLLTKPILIEGDKLRINYATSAPGSVRVGLVDENGWPLGGFSTEDCDLIYGDELEKDVTWHGRSDLSFLRGKAAQLKFELTDADLFALQIVK